MAKSIVNNSRMKLEPYYVLSNAILLKTLTDKQYEEYANRFLAMDNKPDFEKRLEKLLAIPRFKNSLNAYVTKVSDIGSKISYKPLPSLFRTYLVFRTLFKYDAKKLNDFVHYRDLFENSFLIGEYKLAEKVLTECAEVCGETLWYFRSKSLLLAYENKVDELAEYTTSSKFGDERTFLDHQISNIRLLSESDDALYPFRIIILRSIKEFIEAKYHHGASFLALMYSPDPLIDNFDYTNGLQTIQSLPVIDQYNLILSYCQRLIINKYIGSEIDVTETRNFLSKISEFINDSHLKGINEFPERENYEICDASKELFQSYEEGKYLLVIDYFENKLNLFENPFSILNVVAKSYAYLNRKPLKRNNVLTNIVENLVHIYSLSQPQELTEYAITSIAIKLHGFTLSPHLQMCLFIANQNKYKKIDILKAVALCKSSRGQTNPIINGKDLSGSNLCALYSQSIDVEPVNYRKYKAQICKLINSGEHPEEIERLLELYKNSSPLLKDYLELYSEFCLKFDKFDLLIKFCAFELIKSSNISFCFPLETIVYEIESQGIVTIESVIILYMFYKYISTTKEYLLNEYFEDYIHISGFDKPSDLLYRLGELSDFETVFFKDICSLEIMDFLSSFEGSSELRSERVKILDELLTRKIISSDTRSQEMELIVSKYIIDSGISKLNGAKISVDDEALIKKNLETVESLLTQYRESEFHENDRLIDYKIDPTKLEVGAHLTGNKNGILLKIITTLQNSFIQDEKFGLDKNLSTEIRHGFFSSLLRSRLSERYLITEVNEKNEYEHNTYWRQQNFFLSEQLWDAVEEHLEEFSKELNALLSEAEEWMKIKININQESRVFDYRVTGEFFEKIRNLVHSGANATEVSISIMNFLWKNTESNLDEIRKKLNEDFRSKLHIIFDNLFDNIKTTKRSASMSDLMTAITQARGETQEELTQAAKWFRRINNPGMVDHQLHQVIDIAVKAFKEIKGFRMDIMIDTPDTFRNILIPGKSIKSFVLSLFNLFDNAFFHSGYSYDTKLNLQGTLDSESNNVVLLLTNSISEEKQKILTPEYMKSIYEKLFVTESSSFMKVEGGSGLVKAKNELKSISEKSSLNIFIENNNFVVKIVYDY